MSQHHPEREVGANFIELFFDLVFVYAITQVATLIEHDADHRPQAGGRSWRTDRATRGRR